MAKGPQIVASDGTVRQGEMLKPTDLPDLGLAGIDLTFIRIDWQSRLQFDQTEVVILTPFRLVTDGSAQETQAPPRLTLPRT